MGLNPTADPTYWGLNPTFVGRTAAPGGRCAVGLTPIPVGFLSGWASTRQGETALCERSFGDSCRAVGCVELSSKKGVWGP